MTGALSNSLEYIKLLLDTSRLQAECLLDTATSSQIAGISQICRNLKNFSLDPSIVSAIKRRKSLFKTLSTKKGAIRHKAKLISENRKFLLSILLAIKPILIGLVNHFSLSHLELNDQAENSSISNNDNLLQDLKENVS